MPRHLAMADTEPTGPVSSSRAGRSPVPLPTAWRDIPDLLAPWAEAASGIWCEGPATAFRFYGGHPGLPTPWLLHPLRFSDRPPPPAAVAEQPLSPRAPAEPHRPACLWERKDSSGSRTGCLAGRWPYLTEYEQLAKQGLYRGLTPARRAAYGGGMPRETHTVGGPVEPGCGVPGAARARVSPGRGCWCTARWGRGALCGREASLMDREALAGGREAAEEAGAGKKAGAAGRGARLCRSAGSEGAGSSAGARGPAGARPGAGGGGRGSTQCGA